MREFSHEKVCEYVCMYACEREREIKAFVWVCIYEKVYIYDCVWCIVKNASEKLVFCPTGVYVRV